MTRSRLWLIAAVVFVMSFPAAGGAKSRAPSQPRFVPIDVMIESDRPLSAYQVEVVVEAGEATLIGVEGGEPPFDEPPYYDPEALQGKRIILASFHTDKTMPAGMHRVATLHVRELGAPKYRIHLLVAAGADGKRSSARVTLVPRKEAP